MDQPFVNLVSAASPQWVAKILFDWLIREAGANLQIELFAQGAGQRFPLPFPSYPQK